MRTRLEGEPHHVPDSSVMLSPLVAIGASRTGAFDSTPRGVR